MTPRLARWIAGAAMVPCLARPAAAQFPEGYDNGWLVDERIVEVALETVDESTSSEAELAERAAQREIIETTVCRAITYISDGLKVRGYLVAPREGKELPCVIYNRGGDRDHGALSDERAALMLGRIAARGYVVVASQYRGNGGGEGVEEFGGAEIADVLNLIPLLEELNQADARRIGMLGWSRGGMMTYLALARSDRFRGAIIEAGVADSFDLVERSPEMETDVLAQLVPDWEVAREASLATRSAIRWVDRLDEHAPILLLHGSVDRRVHPTQTLRMATALYELGHPFRLVFFEGGDHGLSGHRTEADRMIDDWLDRFVRDGEAVPGEEPHG